MDENWVKTVGVAGAGVMGTGVAQRLAQYGYQVVLLDISDDILKKSKHTVSRNIMLHNMMNSEKISEKAVIDRITTTKDYNDLSQVDILIENIPEVIEQKKMLYEKLSGICKTNCKYLVNTSCIPIHMIASIVREHANVIGVHFMNPVPMQSFAEVIQAETTSSDTIETIRKFLNSIDISCTVIHDSPGFVTNRMSHLFMNEAANLVMEGVALPEQIDMIFEKGFHHKMGPLHTADLIGIDTVANSLDVLYECYQDSKYKCSPYLRQMVQNGELGIKTGKGFFEY